MLFAGLGSIISDLIAELIVLWIFRDANFAQISYQPLLYVVLMGFIPALLTGVMVAYKQKIYADKSSFLIMFLVDFVISALYVATIVLFLGLSFTVDEIGLLFIAMVMFGLFGAINAVITSIFALPKVCITSFDKVVKKGHDVYQGIH